MSGPPKHIGLRRAWMIAYRRTMVHFGGRRPPQRWEMGNGGAAFAKNWWARHRIEYANAKLEDTCVNPTR